MFNLMNINFIPAPILSRILSCRTLQKKALKRLFLGILLTIGAGVNRKKYYGNQSYNPYCLCFELGDRLGLGIFHAANYR